MKAAIRNTLSLAALLLAHAAAQAGVLAEHPGRWMGAIQVPDGPTLRLGADVFTRADGTTWASVASPDQGQYDIPLRTVTENGSTAELDLGFGILAMRWEGDHFKGVWKQGGDNLPLTLRQVDDFPRKARPQTPRAPFPYKDETLAIPGGNGAMLGATLSIPHGVKRPPVVVLVHGSGPSTRDSEVAEHQPFRVLADHLARRGIAVLRYDKRGNGRSSGDYATLTTGKLIDDAHGAVRALRARKQFARVGLIGLSEGSRLSAGVAARAPRDVDFIVSLAGVGLPGLENLLLQDRIETMDAGATAEEADRVVAYVRDYYGTIVAHADADARMAALKTLQAAQPEPLAILAKYKMGNGTLRLEEARNPWLRTLLMSDPRPDWRAVRVPVLALNGSLDHQVPAEQNIRGIVGALREGGNHKVQSAILPKLNHLFQTAQTGKTSEYAAIDESLAPAVLERVAAFVRQQR